MSFFLGNRHKLAPTGLFLTLIDILESVKAWGQWIQMEGIWGLVVKKVKKNTVQQVNLRI
jgi:uncharacterized membrane protein